MFNVQDPQRMPYYYYYYYSKLRRAPSTEPFPIIRWSVALAAVPGGTPVDSPALGTSRGKLALFLLAGCSCGKSNGAQRPRRSGSAVLPVLREDIVYMRMK